jgi:hypothetical protein
MGNRSKRGLHKSLQNTYVALIFIILIVLGALFFSNFNLNDETDINQNFEETALVGLAVDNEFSSICKNMLFEKVKDNPKYQKMDRGSKRIFINNFMIKCNNEMEGTITDKKSHIEIKERIGCEDLDTQINNEKDSKPTYVSAKEIGKHQTDTSPYPVELDCDRDGITNSQDICEGYPDSEDSDSDNIPNGCDSCEGFDDNLDDDSDSIPNGCDPDDDNDGIIDFDDICRGHDDNVDSDNDGVPNGCENEILLADLEVIRPENVGNNYFTPGTYSLGVGDGFGLGNYLIKIVEVGTISAYIEVFKKATNNNYYHFPILGGDEKQVYFLDSYRDLFGITFDFDDYNDQIEVTFFASNGTNCFSSCIEGLPSGISNSTKEKFCLFDCPFDVPEGYLQLNQEIFTVLQEGDYEALAEANLNLLQQAYELNIDFVKYDPEIERYGLVTKIESQYASFSARKESYMVMATTDSLDLQNNLIDGLYAEALEENYMPHWGTPPLSHEIGHSLSPDLSGNKALSEGFAEFIEVNIANPEIYSTYPECQPSGYQSQIGFFPYVDMSTYSSENPSGYYFTGYCFWEDILETYGYGNLVAFFQQRHKLSQGIEDYYILDVMGEAFDEPVSQEILDRYSLIRDATFIENCNNCEIFA